MSELKTMRPFINGEFVESCSKKMTTVYNPSTGEALALVPQCTSDEVEKAIAAAKAAYTGWRNTPVRKRAAIMMKLHQLIERDMDELTQLCATENGKCGAKLQVMLAKRWI